MDTANAKNGGDDEGVFGALSDWAVPAAGLFLLLLVVLGMYVINRAEEATMVEKVFSVDDDIEAVVNEANVPE